MSVRNRLVLSLCAALGLAAVASTPAAVARSGSPIHSVASVGDEIHVRIACKTKESIQAQVNAIIEDKGYARAQAMLAAAREGGECAVAHGSVPVIVVQVGGEVSVFVDSDGDAMSIQVVQIEIGGANYWSVDFRKVQSI